MRTPLLLSCALLAACTDDAGAPPTISSLTYGPSSVGKGMQNTVNGTLQFSDPDGDLDSLNISVTLPSGMETTMPSTKLQGVGDMTTGTVAFAVIFTPPAAGAYQFSLWIVDDAENESNRLDGSLTAQ